MGGASHRSRQIFAAPIRRMHSPEKSAQPSLTLHEFDFGDMRRVIPAPALEQALSVRGVIRLQRWEAVITRGKNEFWHFNLGQASHVVGERYALVRILVAGRHAGSQAEIRPMLDPHSMQCVRVQATEFVHSLADVPEEWLRPSLLPLPSPTGLTAALATKYAVATTELQERIRTRGLTATRLRVLCPLEVADGRLESFRV